MEHAGGERDALSGRRPLIDGWMAKFDMTGASRESILSGTGVEGATVTPPRKPNALNGSPVLKAIRPVERAAPWR
jgi:hypothetical protein